MQGESLKCEGKKSVRKDIKEKVPLSPKKYYVLFKELAIRLF